MIWIIAAAIAIGATGAFVVLYGRCLDLLTGP